MSYERRDYQSVEEKSILSYVTKNDGKKNPGQNGLKVCFIVLFVITKIIKM